MFGGPDDVGEREYLSGAPRLGASAGSNHSKSVPVTSTSIIMDLDSADVEDDRSTHRRVSVAFEQSSIVCRLNRRRALSTLCGVATACIVLSLVFMALCLRYVQVICAPPSVNVTLVTLGGRAWDNVRLTYENG